MSWSQYSFGSLNFHVQTSWIVNNPSILTYILQAKKTYEEAHVDKNPWWYSKGIATWLRRNRVTLDDVGHRIVAAARDVNRRFHPARAMFVTTNPSCTIIHRSHQPFTFLVVTSHESHGTFHLALHPVSLHCFFHHPFLVCFFAVIPGRTHGPRRDGARHDGCRGRHSGARALVALARPVTVTSAILGWKNDGKRFFGSVMGWTVQSED